MKKVMTFAGLALIAMFALTGCHKIRKCTVGQPGCVGGVPLNGECAAGLEKLNGKCVEPGGGPTGPCDCAFDELCAPDGETCLTYCEPVDELPVTTLTPPACKPFKTAADDMPDPFTFAELCQATCMQRCVHAQAYCPGYNCNPADCDTAAERARCLVACPSMEASCMEGRCVEQSKVTCTDFMCPGSSTRSCQDINCRDSCTGNTNDGFCDDGDPYSATYSFCGYGTDCTDCGPRRGTTRPARIPLGEPCPEGQDVSCEGYNDDFLKTEAWCLRFIGGADAAFRCVPDCTTEDGEGQCDDGYECKPVTNAMGEPYRDAVNRTAGFACVPQICE